MKNGEDHLISFIKSSTNTVSYCVFFEKKWFR